VELNIPVNPRNGRKPRQYNIELYRRMRSAVERFFGWLKSFRRITIRYERLASTYKALVTIEWTDEAIYPHNQRSVLP
jgi:transposase